MTVLADFTVPGVVKSERKRQRFIPGKGRVGHRTDEPDRADFKARVSFYARQALAEPYPGPVRLTLVVSRPQPASYPKKPTKGKPWPWADMAKPDADNYAKILQDALNGILFVDDAQIIGLEVCKVFGPHRVRVLLREADELWVALAVEARAKHGATLAELDGTE